MTKENFINLLREKVFFVTHKIFFLCYICPMTFIIFAEVKIKNNRNILGTRNSSVLQNNGSSYSQIINN